MDRRNRTYNNKCLQGTLIGKNWAFNGGERFSKSVKNSGVGFGMLSRVLLSNLLGQSFLDLLLIVDGSLLLFLSVLIVGSFAFKNLFSEELVLPLGFVSSGTGHEHASTHGASRNEDGNGVNSELSGVLDTEFKNTPPVETIEKPETAKGNKNTKIVLTGVLVNTLVISSLSRVVSLSLTLDLRGGSSLGLRVSLESIRVVRIEVIVGINAAEIVIFRSRFGHILY